MPGWLDPAIVAAGFFGMIALAAAGISRLVVPGRRLASRLESYESLPVLPELEAAAVKLENLQAALDRLPVLVDRVRAALRTIMRAGEQLQRSAAAARSLVYAFRRLLVRS